jgi:hypothetical protein
VRGWGVVYECEERILSYKKLIQKGDEDSFLEKII